ncbi:hypothetical protein [Dyadobacter sp. CY356]|uniref:hypothetical protein n=1 Tax=Dyadobacter sp. CY356 TaxID=2906442 RepID=UPI001F357365|nr:hypothetical protein [Dyadobacter sp. CY356]MCF0057236.1 hypothetical protein [Dyadobacter sp. CY356]
MQHTFRVNTENLNQEFIKNIQLIFGKKEILINVTDLENDKIIDQREIYKKSLEIRERFKNMKIDPNLDLSSMANDVNL